jgi:2-succinyl-5-enolpyruvyl-6-hydroxy-3-cyclohexene-1-carboxylate synthase
MSRSNSNLHLAWARLFLRAAAAAGVTDVVLSPGSRSTPLTIAAATTSELRVHVIVDERSAAFFALGQARVTGRPSLLICTSGTAGAHWLPALIEASQSFIPLIAVTADRPWELQDCAAPQTIDQLKLFGDHVRHFADLGLPDPSPGALRAVPRIAAQAVAIAMGPLPGPVHINARFRKPLEPVEVDGPEAWQPLVDALLARGPTRVAAPTVLADEDAIVAIATIAGEAKRGLLVCGPAPLASAAGREAILDLARATGFPLLAEGPSQLRFGGDRRGVVTLSAFDALLRGLATRADLAPDLVIEIGAPPTSAGYARLLAERPLLPRVVIAPHGWNDPAGTATALIVADPAEAAARISAKIRGKNGRSAAPFTAWAEQLGAADRRAVELADEALAGDALSEGSVVQALVASCPAGAILAIGNSTPVRDLDAYCPANERDLRVAHQRGASGIDGLVSGAAGARSVSAAPVALLLGDLSLLHDLTGLALLRRASGPFVAVVVQNGGGRIFDHLPIAESWESAAFERFFATPEPVHFDHAAAAFGVTYARATTRAELDLALTTAWSAPGPTLIEAVAPPREGAKKIAALWTAVRAELADRFPEGATS